LVLSHTRNMWFIERLCIATVALCTGSIISFRPCPKMKEALTMETPPEDPPALSKPTLSPLCERMPRVAKPLDAATGQLYELQDSAQGRLLEVASPLRQKMHTRPVGNIPGETCLLAWQAHMVHAYIDSHISGPILVADLCALVRRSKAHFSRSFKRTFGESPHSFVVRRRVELAAHYMRTTEAPLSDIAVRCGFVDQAHLCKHFRRCAGQTPAAWRRVYRFHYDGNAKPPIERHATPRRGDALAP